MNLRCALNKKFQRGNEIHLESSLVFKECHRFLKALIKKRETAKTIHNFTLLLDGDFSCSL